MIESTVDIPTADGGMDVFVTHPEEGGPFAAVVVLMDIWGLREELFDIARRIATAGYHCTVPNFWYRRGKVRYEFRDDNGRMLSFLSLPQATRDEIHANARQVTDRMAMADLGSLLSFLDRQAAARPGPVGAVGYCLGGRYALAAAAEYPDRFRACASMHGTTLVSEAADSPHRHVDRMRGEIYCGFAERDPWAPASTIETLAALFRDRPDVHYRAVVHPGTEHGYALPDRDIFHKAAANRDWAYIFAMFRRRLG